ncbi:MAG: hypothetical protein Q9187_008713, partial [Circinaria calcarea]
MPSPKPRPNPTLEDSPNPLVAEGIVLCDAGLAGGVVKADTEVVVVWDVTLVDEVDKVEVEVVEVVTEDS